MEKLKIETTDEWRRLCPYGLWTCADGREVLFNRQYRPILERRNGQAARAANPGEWVNWIEQDWFFGDATAPWRKPATVERVNAVLAAWSLPLLPPVPSEQSGALSPVCAGRASYALPEPYINPWRSRLFSACHA